MNLCLTMKIFFFSFIFVKHNQCTFFSPLIPLEMTNINTNAQWIPNAITVAVGHGQDNGFSQCSRTFSVYIADVPMVYVGDSSNHRLVEMVQVEKRSCRTLPLEI